MHTFNHYHARLLLVFAVGLIFPACAAEPVKGTATAADEDIVPGEFCAVPQFADTGPTQGTNYPCGGKVNGTLKVKVCDPVCPDDEDPHDKVFPIDGLTGDGEIPFPPVEDPTEGEGEGEHVYACCHPDIELGGPPGSTEGVEACASACAHSSPPGSPTKISSSSSSSTCSGCEHHDRRAGRAGASSCRFQAT